MSRGWEGKGCGRRQLLMGGGAKGVVGRDWEGKWCDEQVLVGRAGSTRSEGAGAGGGRAWGVGGQGAGLAGALEPAGASQHAVDVWSTAEAVCLRQRLRGSVRAALGAWLLHAGRCGSARLRPSLLVFWCSRCVEGMWWEELAALRGEGEGMA